MTVIKSAGMLGVATFLMAAAPIASATAQTQSPSLPQTSTPEIVRPAPEQRQVMPSVKTLVGLAVMSSDGRKLGTVQSADMRPDGKTAIFLKTGGFLGFGGHVVEVPEGKFTRSGEFIQLGMTAEEVSKLPVAKD
jgi:sporulation protein YlmC with PRC-barrel domain